MTVNGLDRSRCNIAPRITYDDLRQWLEEARKLGEVKDVSGLSWQQDIGLLSELALHDDTRTLLRLQ